MTRWLEARFRSVFVVLTVAWALLVPAAAFAASRPSGEWTGGYVLALVVYRLGGLLCHQRPERSFVLFGAQLPVCARCAGIYAGAALTMAAASTWVRAPLGRPVDRRMLVLAAVPAALTLLFEWTTGRMPGHWIRALSGAPLGAVVAWVVYASIGGERTSARPR